MQIKTTEVMKIIVNIKCWQGMEKLEGSFFTGKNPVNYEPSSLAISEKC